MGSSACAPPVAVALLASKYSMKHWRASGLRLKTRSSASARCSAGISARGVMWAGLTMARSSPACTQWCRKTELSTPRAWGARPKLTLLTPSTVSTPGMASLMRRMPSMVAAAESLNSSSPVARVKVRSSKMRASFGRPYSPQTMAWMRWATSSLRAAVLAMPTSSMVSATTAAPCSRTWGSKASMRVRPFSRWTELTMARPGLVLRASTMTAGSVESIIRDASMPMASFLTTLRICSTSSPRSVRATHTSRTCAPPSTCSRATSRTPS
ncbi:hypothetical protein D3C86_1358390 [compost metagenome]